MIWTVFWKEGRSAQGSPENVASFPSLDEAARFCRQIRSRGKRVSEVIGPWGKTLNAANIANLYESEGDSARQPGRANARNHRDAAPGDVTFANATPNPEEAPSPPRRAVIRPSSTQA